MLRLNSGNRDFERVGIESSILYLTYIQTGILPTVDELLDWRLQLDVLKSKKEFPAEWFDREILATDYLISINSP